MENEVYNTNVPVTAVNGEILHAILGQLSDGIWENSPRMEPYWKFAKFTEDGDGMFVLELDPRHPLYKSYKNPVEWYANVLKRIVKTEFEDNPKKKGEWSRTCTTLLDYVSYYEKVTVSDAYKVYDLMKGRDAEANAKRAQAKQQKKLDEIEKERASALAEVEARYAEILKNRDAELAEVNAKFDAMLKQY